MVRRLRDGAWLNEKLSLVDVIDVLCLFIRIYISRLFVIGFHGGSTVLVLDVFGSTAGSGVMVSNEDLYRKKKGKRRL